MDRHVGSLEMAAGASFPGESMKVPPSPVLVGRLKQLSGLIAHSEGNLSRLSAAMERAFGPQPNSPSQPGEIAGSGIVDDIERAAYRLQELNERISEQLDRLERLV